METGLSTFITTVTAAMSDLSVTNVGSVIVAALGLAIPLILAWFAFRFIYGKLKDAFFGG